MINAARDTECWVTLRRKGNAWDEKIVDRVALLGMRKVCTKHKLIGAANTPLAKLQLECSRALDRYVRAAEGSRAFMMQATECPFDPEQREVLLEHLGRETRAHDAYMRSRRQLWTLLAGTGRSKIDVLKLAA